MKVVLTGKASTGKTTRLIEKYLVFRSNDSFNNNGYFLVPYNEHATAVRKSIIEQTPEKVLFNDNIMSVNQFIQSKYPLKPISDLKKQLIITKIIREKGFFREFADIFALYEHLSDVIKEIRHYKVDLEKMSTQSSKLRVLGEITKIYLNELDKLGLIDSEMIYENIQIKEKIDYLILDGFDSFTPLQFDLITQLIDISQDTVISLTYDDTRKPLFLEERETLNFFLKKDFKQENITANYLHNDIRAIEEAYFDDLKSSDKKSSNVKQLIGDNVQLEYELICREIIDIQKKYGYKWSDIAVVFRQIGDKKQVLQNVFNNYKIPLLVHEGLYLRKSFLLTWIMQIYELALNNLEKESLLLFVHSGYANISSRNVFYLESLFDRYPLAEKLSDIIEYIKDKDLLFYLSVLMKSVENLLRCSSFKEEWDVLDKFCKFNKIESQLKSDLQLFELEDTARENLRAYSQLKNYYKELDEHVPRETLRNSYRYTNHFLSQEIVSLSDNSEESVQVYDLPSIRQKSYKVLFVADFIFGNYPLPQINNTLLTNEERNYLGLKDFVSKQNKENTLFYQLLTRGTEHLYFCSYKYSLSGTPVSASIYLDQISKVIRFDDSNTICKTYSDIFKGLNSITESEYKYILASYLYELYPDYPDDSNGLIDLPDLELLNDLIQKKTDLKKQREFRDDVYQIMIEKTKTLSVTAIEDYENCPFLFFMRHLLSIQSPEKFSIFLERGRIIHKVLEEYYVDNKSRSLENIEIDVAPILDKYLRTLEQKVHSKIIKLEQKVLLEKLLFFIRHDLVGQTGGFKPTYLEYEVLSDRINDVEIVGKVDRIDINNNELKIIDYKTGALPEGKERLYQIAIYALLLQDTPLSKNSIADLLYLQFPSYKTKSIEWDGKFVLEKVSQAVKYIRSAEFYTPTVKCSSFCPYKKICPTDSKKRYQ